MTGQSGSLCRTWHVHDILYQGVQFTIILDASPLGLGGIFMEDGVIVSWVSSKLTKHDEQHSSITRSGKQRDSRSGRRSAWLLLYDYGCHAGVTRG